MTTADRTPGDHLQAFPAALLVVVLALTACDGDESADRGDSTVAVSTTERSSPGTGTPTSTNAPGTSPAPPSSTAAPSPSSATDAPGTSDPNDTDGGESLGPLGETEVEIETDGGSVQIGSGTVPPSAAPVPLPEDLEVRLASESDGSAGLSGTSASTVTELADFFRRALPEAGFEIVDDQDAGSAVFLVFARPGEVGQVAISADPSGDGSTVIVAFGPA